ncbi:MAG: hypothetical protein AAGI45_10300 [Cyanobacteria bacterium P01_H01_bin.26]
MSSCPRDATIQRPTQDCELTSQRWRYRNSPPLKRHHHIPQLLSHCQHLRPLTVVNEDACT